MYTFQEIIGNETIIKSMRAAITNKKVSHAYIIEGGPGMGKKLLANTFAKALLCEDGGVDACLKCFSCRSYDSLNNPDLIFVRPEKTKAVGVNDIREQVKRTVDIKPYRGNYKIYLIEDAGSMTEQAQNALLKTLEEPPAYAVFILLTENSAGFLQTVLSRCVIFKLRPLRMDLVQRHLVKSIPTDEQTARFYAAYARGSIGAALRLAVSETFVEMRRNVTDILRKLQDSDLIQLFATAKQLAEYKEDMQEALDVAHLWYRDIAVYMCTSDESLCLQGDLMGEIAAQSEQSDISAVLSNMDLIWETKRRLKYNANLQLALEVLLLKLASI